MHLIWPGFNDNDTVLIDMSNEPFHLPKAYLYINDQRFIRKDELHVTLLGSELGRLLKERQATEAGTEDKIKTIFEAIDWSYTQSGPIHLLSRLKEGNLEESIIMLINMPGMKVFYQTLIQKGYIEKDTPLPPAHVTLYTYNNPHGIGVSSQDVLKTLSVSTFSVDEFNAQCARHN